MLSLPFAAVSLGHFVHVFPPRHPTSSCDQSAMEQGGDQKPAPTSHPQFSRAATARSCNGASVRLVPTEAEERPPTSICLEEHVIHHPCSRTEEKGLRRKLG